MYEFEFWIVLHYTLHYKKRGGFLMYFRDLFEFIGSVFLDGVRTFGI